QQTIIKCNEETVSHCAKSSRSIVFMKKIRLYIIICVTMATYIQESNHGSALAKITLGKSDAENNNRIWSKEEYLNTQFLNQYTAVSQQLCNDGFYEGYFTTTDQFSINYLYLKRPNAIATIIFCSGFLPGRK